MCLVRIRKAISETEQELRAAAQEAGKLSPAQERVLSNRLKAFGHLQATLDLIKETQYDQHPDPCSEDPCFPPHSQS
jgi:hypothetical protein